MIRVTRIGIFVFLGILVVGVVGDEVQWEVRTKSGVVRGARASHGDYYSFLGIPFGAPPTGDKRFKAPEPATPWDGVLVANKSRLCVQPQSDGGQEDCLTLDIFAPSPAPRPYPVFVFFYGGKYLLNATPVTAKNVRRLLNYGIVVVAVNYRLGALGFLCLGTKDAPGNAGLRDQILGLKWVQNNIAAFGGDPDNVTAGGISAGASAVHILAAAPEAYDLFKRGISIDGTSVTEKTFMTHPVTSARKFAKLIGFDSDNVAKLTEFYKEVPVERILKAGMEFTQLDNGESGFCPCVERPLYDVRPIVDDAPSLTLYRNKRPMLFTFVNYDGSTRAEDLVKKQKKYNTDFPAFTAANLEFPNNDIKYEVANETKAFYFGNRRISNDTAVEFSNFWGDRQSVYQAAFSAREHAKLGNMAHLLEFTYFGNLSYPKTEPIVPGASHGDLYNYVFPEKEPNNENDRRVVEQAVSIMAQFIKTGSAPWQPVSPFAEQLSYLHLDKEMKEVTSDSPLLARLAFWDRIYRQYRRVNYLSYRDRDDEIDVKNGVTAI